MGLLPVHVPLTQRSVCVHELPSLQLVPSGAAGFEQVPLAGLQVPAAWHWSAAEQTIGLVPLHAPLWHVSVCVQALPSLHVVPFGTAPWPHVPSGLHVSSVHGFPSSHPLAAQVAASSAS